MKHVFSAEIWFIKTSTRIMKDKHKWLKQTLYTTVYLFGRIEVVFLCNKKKEIKKDQCKLTGKKFKNAIK